MNRFETSEDPMDDCITITDTEDELKSDFGSEIVLYPLDDAQLIIDELNIQCATVQMLKEQLESFEDEQDIEYWIKEIREDYYFNGDDV